jgi:hypothetical protein
MTVVCHSCKNEVSEDFKFCPFCGTKITNFVKSDGILPEDIKKDIINELQNIFIRFRGGEYEKRIGTAYYDGETTAEIRWYNIPKITAEQDIQPLIEKFKGKEAITVNDVDYVYDSFRDIFYINHIHQFKEIEELFHKLDDNLHRVR